VSSSEQMVLSVIVIIASDTTELRADVSLLISCLKALTRQVDHVPTEIIVPYYPPSVDGIESLLEAFPDVAFIPVSDLKVSNRSGGSREHHDVLKTRGLLEARGEIVGFLEDNETPDEMWCARTIEAHREKFAGIGGAIENGVDLVLNWAVYYCDFGRYQNPVSPGQSIYASDANVSYKRSALESIRGVWEQSFNEVPVNTALISQGEKLALRPDVIAYQQRRGLRIGTALRERYIWGRSFGAVRCQVLSGPKRLVFALLSPLLPGVVALKMTMTAIRKRRNFGKFLKALPLILILLASWGLGEMVGYLTARSS